MSTDNVKYGVHSEAGKLRKVMFAPLAWRTSA